MWNQHVLNDKFKDCNSGAKTKHSGFQVRFQFMLIGEGGGCD